MTDTEHSRQQADAAAKQRTEDQKLAVHRRFLACRNHSAGVQHAHLDRY